MRKNHDRLGTIGLYALMISVGALMLMIALRTAHLDDNAYDMMRGVFYMDTTTLLSILLYGMFFTAVGVRVWAGRKKHHHIRWCSVGNITFTAATYCSFAGLCGINDSTVPIDAVLHPLFWSLGDPVNTLKWVCAIIGLAFITYWTAVGVTRISDRISEHLAKKKPLTQREIDGFYTELLTGDPWSSPALRAACRTFRREQKTTNTRTGD